jgi:hypothetical protein
MWKSGMGAGVLQFRNIWKSGNWGGAGGQRVSESDLITEKEGTGGYYTK